MTATSTLRGHDIYWDDSEWRFCDTRAPTASTHYERPCGHCGRHDTAEGHDGCLGTLPGVMNACCGHGQLGEAYIQYPGGDCVRGPAAIEEQRRLVCLTRM